MENEKSKEIRAYGMTHGEMEKIRLATINQTVKMILANSAEDIKDKYFATDFMDGHEIPEHEKGFYHIVVESRTFDPGTGERLSIPRIQVYDTATFDHMMAMKPYNGFHGLTTHILHNPRKAVKVAPAATTGTGDEYAHLKDAKEAKAEYKTLTGIEPVRTWKREQAIAKIIEFKASNPK